jgi:hypothetical protein
MNLTKDEELFFHIFARACLYRAGGFYTRDNWDYPTRIYHRLIWDFNLRELEIYQKTIDSQFPEKELINRPDAFVNRLFESKPWAIFTCIEDEDYVEQIRGFVDILPYVSRLSFEEQMYLADLIIQHGNDHNPSALCQLQQP